MRAGHEKTRQCVKKHKRVNFKKRKMLLFALIRLSFDN